jgi:hypothetical protein
MAVAGVKSSFTRDMRAQVKKMREQGLSQISIAKAFGVDRSTISRLCAKLDFEAANAPVIAPSDDPVAFAQSFPDELHCLVAIGREATRHPPEWSDVAMRARREKWPRGR